MAQTQSPRFSRTTPEAQGISSEAILGLVEELERSIDAVHSIMIVRRGEVVAEGWWTPYAPQEPHVLFSLSKSFTSSAVGLAIAEGKLRLEDPVLSFFPSEAPAEVSENLKQMRVRDLLMMSTGQHAEDVEKVNYFSDEPATRQFLALPVPHKPGTHFYYNTPASYMLSAIIQRTTGQSTLEYLQSRLLAPLGIENASWDADPRGISLGGFGMSIRTEDIAAFGQLYLQRGEWKGKRLLPAAWVDLATSRQASNGSNPDSDWDQGYGFQFWRTRHGLYRGDGAFGQFCIVMPQYDTVVAITSGTKDMAGVMNILWSKFLPELRPAALPANEPALARLRQKLGSLTLQPVKGGAQPANPSLLNRTFRFTNGPDGLESVRLAADAQGTRLVYRYSGIEYVIPVGSGAWAKGGSRPYGGSNSSITTPGSAPVAASGAWTSPDTFTAKLALYRSPFIRTVRLRFADGKLTHEEEPNVGFGPITPRIAEGLPE